MKMKKGEKTEEQVFYKNMRKIFLTVVLMVCFILSVVIEVKAESPVSVPIMHKHITECEVPGTEVRSATSSSGPSITETDTCDDCGGTHHKYRFTASCTCGKTWSRSGHACVNSPYGKNQGSCSNYKRVNTDTSHDHPVMTYGCGYTNTSEVAVLTITPSTELPVQALELEASITGGESITNLTYEWNDLSVLTTLLVGENGSYAVTVRGDNIIDTTATIVISNIDTTMPDITMSADITELTAEDVLITAVGTDASGLAAEPYSWDGGVTWGTVNTCTVSSNGTYTVFVKDVAGNVAEKNIVIENIDKTAPDITMSADTTSKTTGKVTLTAVGTDASGLAAEPYSWDGGVTWGMVNTCTVSSNGTYTVFVKDSVGNIGSKGYSVSNIYKKKKKADTTPPVIVDLYPDTTDPAQQVILTVVVDEEDVLISWDGGITWGTEDTTVATANATHTVLVKDQAGNTASKSYEVTNIYVPRVEPEPVREEKSTEELASENSEEESVEPFTPAVESEPKLEEETVVETVEVEEPEIRGSLNFGQVFTVSAPIAGGGCCFFILFWFAGKNATLYSQSGLQEKRLGRLKIKKNKDGFIITIPDSMLCKATSNFLRIHVAKHIWKKNRGEQVKINMANKEIFKTILQDIYVEE